jgi:hypothetical protein
MDYVEPDTNQGSDTFAVYNNDNDNDNDDDDDAYSENLAGRTNVSPMEALFRIEHTMYSIAKCMERMEAPVLVRYNDPTGQVVTSLADESGRCWWHCRGHGVLSSSTPIHC